ASARWATISLTDHLLAAGRRASSDGLWFASNRASRLGVAASTRVGSRDPRYPRTRCRYCSNDSAILSAQLIRSTEHWVKLRSSIMLGFVSSTSLVGSAALPLEGLELSKAGMECLLHLWLTHCEHDSPHDGLHLQFVPYRSDGDVCRSSHGEPIRPATD